MSNNARISELNNLETSEDSDVIVIVDSSETDVSIKTKKQTKDNFLKELNERIDEAETDISEKIDSSEKGAANGVATLGADQKIPSSQLPALAITETFVVLDEAEMLALSSAEKGDVAVRVDLNKTFILAGDDSSVLEDWQELKTPTDNVLSVNGQTGAVLLTTSHISEGSNLYYTDSRSRSAISESITGIDYDSSTGVFSMTSGYAIPTSTKQTQWDTAYSWGNHASAGYLTSYTETDTLQSVTTKGATTTSQSTFSGGVVTSLLKANASGGLLIEADNGTDVALFGAGNTSATTLYGQLNLPSGGAIDFGNGSYTMTHTGGLPVGTLTTVGRFSASRLITTGEFFGAIGTVGNPTYTFTTDTNTGMYSSGADSLDFSTGGTGRMQITTTYIASGLRLTGIVGTASLPSFGFTNESGMGMYRITTGTLGFSVNSSLMLQVSGAGVSSASVFRGVSTSASAPAYANANDTDTGMYFPFVGGIALATNGTLRIEIGDTYVRPSVPIRGGTGTVGSPTFSFFTDSDTGIWSNGANQLAFSTGGVNRMEITPNGTVRVGGTRNDAQYGFATNEIIETSGASSGGFYVSTTAGSNVGVLMTDTLSSILSLRSFQDLKIESGWNSSTEYSSMEFVAHLNDAGTAGTITFSFEEADATNENGGSYYVYGGDAVSSDSGNGGSVNHTGGNTYNNDGTHFGGAVNLTGGTSFGADGWGGTVTITGGSSQNYLKAGEVRLQGGYDQTGYAHVHIQPDGGDTDISNSSIIVSQIDGKITTNIALVLLDYTTVSSPVVGMVAYDYMGLAIVSYNGTAWV